MNKVSNYFGIDISKDVFDVMDKNSVHYQFKNNESGFRSFSKLLSKDSYCVMEATGYYHYQLASYLLNCNFLVSVANPLSVKRFIQMRLSKIKTDRSDAKMICLYAQKVELKLWTGHSANQLDCLQITRMLSVYTKQSTALKNKIHGEEVLGEPCLLVVKSIKRSLKNIIKEMKILEDKLNELVKLDHQDLLSRIETIPGLGRKTATMLIVLTDGFSSFSKGSELCSYAGLTPVIRQSGSSVRGRSRISKIGNQKLRNLLFMCSFTACIHNKACREIYQRIVAKGKSKKLALMAVCNKLLKQAFAIAKSGLIYEESYKSINPVLK